MDRWDGKVAIVTGASAGIGVDIAAALVEKGLKVVGAARSLDKLEKLAAKLKSCKGKFYPIQCDLRKEEDILKVFEWTEKELGGVNVLVNNAGVLASGTICDSPTENFRKVLDVNVIAAAICTRETVRSIKKRNSYGHIFNINSIAGHYADSIKLPIGLYPASKYALHAMTLALRNEMVAAKLDIKVTGISPGAVDTAMIREVNLPANVVEMMPKLRGKDVADSVIYALFTPHETQVWDILITPHDALSTMADPEPWRKTMFEN